jgi:hypothetical protein
MSATAAASPEIIEGVFRVVATTDASPARKSPNRQRQVARIVFWNTAMLVAVVALPMVF